MFTENFFFPFNYNLERIFNPRRTCTATVTVVGLSVCVCVDTVSDITGYEVANERYQRLQNYTNLENLLGGFPATAAFERYAVKTSKKANMHNRAGLPPTDWLTPHTLEA